MTYTPAFLEIFVGYVAYLFWSAWLGRKGQWPIGMQWGPLVVGSVFMIGLVVSMRSTMNQPVLGYDGTWVERTRWGILALVALGLLVDAGFTVRLLRTPRQPETGA